MIDQLPSAAHVVALRVSGTITGDDIDRATGMVESALDREARIGLYADMMDFTDMTAEAFVKDLRYGLSKLGEWGRFHRAAVMTDKEWLRAIVRLESHLIPHVEIRVFGKNEREAALAWASGLPAPAPAAPVLSPVGADDPGES
ncbi:STAS/SEC14 domain-containing protein [Microvirga flavescens]|uniref:STAS/SEC14 domain-containing protein n=1 Tax=Microvirga flavescens TaxID=2249811 RepID=UPI000DD71DE3|nr:STAS/SEC14 domain-containing protein [Microvirga flavescens]